MGEATRRILVQTLDASGNWPPIRELVRALVARGHHVRVMSHDLHADDIRSVGATFRPYGVDLQRRPYRSGMTPQEQATLLFESVLANPAYGDALLEEAASDPPDALLVDFMLFGGRFAAETTRLPTAVLWHTVFGALTSRTAPMPEALAALLSKLRAQLRLDPVSDPAGLAGHADSVIVFTEPAFDSPPDRRPPRLTYAGPLGCLSTVAAPFVWERDPQDARPLIVVSYSTGFQDQAAALQRVADAVEHLEARVLLTLGRAMSAEQLRLPANITATAFVPHGSVLPQAALVVTHAGHGTVMAALTAGVPLVCTPMGRDQPDVAARVARLGLGIVVPNTATADQLRQAISTAIGDTDLTMRVRAFARQIDVPAGLARALAEVERLAVATAGTPRRESR